MNTEWKPIASAPENEGRPLFCELCWGPEGDQSVGTGFRHNGKWYAAGLFYCVGQEKRYELREVEVQPTHWKPQSDLPDEESPAPTSHPIPTGATGEDGEKPYCYALETRGRHAGIDDVLLDVEYNGTDNFSGGRTGGIPLYRRRAPAAGDALDAARYRWMRDIARDEQCQEDGAIYARRVQFTSGVMTGSRVLTEDDLDTAIDAAIAQQKGEA